MGVVAYIGLFLTWPQSTSSDVYPLRFSSLICPGVRAFQNVVSGGFMKLKNVWKLEMTGLNAASVGVSTPLNI